MSLKLKRWGNTAQNREFRNDTNKNWETIEYGFNNVVEITSDSAFNKVVGAAKIVWLAPVNKFSDLATTYPEAIEGNTVMTRDTGKIYRFNGITWMEIQDIDPTAINEVDKRVSKKINDMMVNIRDFGAHELLEDNRLAIQKAIDYVEANGGGTVYIPKGVFYVKGINLTILLRSNVSIRGDGKWKSVLKISKITGDWGYLLIGGQTDVLENVSISDLTLDCNVDNPVTKTERWQNSNRVLVNVGEAINFRLHNVKMITNGIWGFRGFVEHGEISDCELHFYPPNYSGASFDVSTIWLGGKFNKVKNNTLIGHWRSNFIPETGIEAQGHYSHYENNVVKGYKVGMIMSNNTGYENKLNPILELGALYNKIINNTFEVLVGGLTLWAMNIVDGSYLRGCQVANNNFKIIEGNNVSGRYRYGIGVFKANLATGSTHDGVQTGKINTLKINNNHIEFENRVISDTISFADVGIRLDSEFEIEGTDISQNTLYNIGGFGVYLSASVDYALNPYAGLVKNTVIQNNLFLEVRKPVKVNTRVKRTTIINNTFVQQIDYPNVLHNMLITIEAYSRSAQETGGFYIKNNTVQSSIKNHRPFYPKYLLGISISNYSPDFQDILEENVLGQVVVQAQTDRYNIVQKGNSVIGKDGLRYGLTNAIQATLGVPHAPDGDVIVTERVNETMLKFNDTFDIHPSQSLVLKKTDGTYRVVTVLSVFKEYVLFTVNINDVAIGGKVKYYSDNLGLVK
ncbi:hypothetical protein [Bacillus mobilis]|uniref:hypothetical protein n=1 Tax=Bacillus mobilis TaxID=2026190 RepID=UPI003CF87ECC